MANKQLEAQRTLLYGAPEEARLNLVQFVLGEAVQGLEQWPHLKLAQVQLHQAALGPFTKLWESWRDRGLMPLVLSFDKSYRVEAERYGAHAWGNAFDINTEWNQLTTHGAARGAKGSTHELEAVARARGWTCGRVWPYGRAPRHFELLTERPTVPRP